MKTKKTPYSIAGSLKLIPVSSIISFAVILSKVYLQHKEGNYEVSITPGSFIQNVQEEGYIYKINHTFSVPFACLDNDRELQLFSKQELIAIYINESGQQVVSGSVEYPLSLSYTSSGSKYQCTLTGKATYPEAFLA